MGSLITGALQAVGVYAQGHAAAQSARYNSQVQLQNAEIAKNNQAIASQSGQVAVEQQQQKARALVGATMANQGASGVDVNSGSAVDVRSSESQLAMMDSLNTRSQAVREAYGYQIQEHDAKAKSSLDEYESKYDEAAGILGAGTTFLSSVNDSARQVSKLAAAGAL